MLIKKIYKKINNKSIDDYIYLLSESTLKIMYNEFKNQEPHQIEHICENTTTNAKENVKETDKSDIYIFTDGNCKNNGKRNALGAYGIYFTENKENELYNFNKVEKVENPTNQKCELMAFNELFKLLNKNNNIFKNKKIVICSDSMYSINCITKWYLNWNKNNWKTAKGENVKNVEIIKEIIENKEKIQNNISIDFKHVLSHLPEPSKENNIKYKLWYGNNKVDEMINKFLDKNN